MRTTKLLIRSARYTYRVTHWIIRSVRDTYECYPLTNQSSFELLSSQEIPKIRALKQGTPFRGKNWRISVTSLHKTWQIAHFDVPDYISTHFASFDRRDLLTIKMVTVTTCFKVRKCGQLISRLQKFYIFRIFRHFPSGKLPKSTFYPEIQWFLVKNVLFLDFWVPVAF